MIKRILWGVVSFFSDRFVLLVTDEHGKKHSFAFRGSRARALRSVFGQMNREIVTLRAELAIERGE
jgi:hypothetical protein